VSCLFGLRFQNKVAVAMAIAGIASMVDFGLALIWTYPYCGPGNADCGGGWLAQDSGLLLVFGILLVGFSIVIALDAWNPTAKRSK
jgi:hypothetical protein